MQAATRDVRFGTMSGAPIIGQVLGGRYHVLDKIGEGGMGQVYAAEHVGFGKRVAVKLLLHCEGDALRGAAERFHKEAQAAGAVDDDNVIQVHDFGQLPDGRPYMVMDLLEGEPLDKILADGAIAPARAFLLLGQVCRGLAATHAKGIVHRDLKPPNIFVTRRGNGEVPKILDFGIAKVFDAQNQTATGMVCGTAEYMAPEQALAAAIDHRVDIYAMGIILYEMFTGVVPFRGPSFMTTMQLQISAQPLPPSRVARSNHRALPDGIEAVILKCLEKEPAMRYQSMTELSDAIAACAGATAVPKRRPRGNRRRLALVAAGVAAVVAGALTVSHLAAARPSPIFVRVAGQDPAQLGAELRAAVEHVMARHPMVVLTAPPAGAVVYSVAVATDVVASAADGSASAAAPGDTRVSFKLTASGSRSDLGTATFVIPRPTTPYSSPGEREAAITAAVESSDLSSFLDEGVIMHDIMRSGALTRCLPEVSVQLAFDVDASGRVSKATATAGGGSVAPEATACLDEAARSWRFHPAHALRVTFTRTVH